MKPLILSTLAILAFWSLPIQAQQDPPCADRAEFLKHLRNNFKEGPVAMGLTSNGNLLEVLVSAYGSWSIIVTSAAGLSCGVASGSSWESLNEIKEGNEL